MYHLQTRNFFERKSAFSASKGSKSQSTLPSACVNQTLNIL